MDSIPSKKGTKMKNRPRVLRLHLSEANQDTPVCYLHTKSTSTSCINGQEGKISILLPSAPIPSEDGANGLTVVIGKLETPIAEGAFISFGEGEPVLRTTTLNKNGSIGAEVVVPGFLTVSQTLEVWKPIRVGVLTVSDKGSRGERQDTAGPALVEMVSKIGGDTLFQKIVPDETSAIQETLCQWSREDCHLILTTGGTGLSTRDVTPESLLAVADRQVPGLGEYIRMKTAENTPRAILSRGLAVTIGKTLVLSFPGSERGARECFEVVSPVLRHAVEILLGWGGECGGHHHHP